MGPRPRSNWRRKRKSPWLSESSLLMLMPWTLNNSKTKPRSFGTLLSGWRPRNTILQKGKRGKTMMALTGKYPPKIRMYSKYERRTDTRTYEDRRKLYEG